MVAAAVIRRAAWAGVALLAAGSLGFMALHGERPDAGMERFETAGFLATVEKSSIRRVVVDAGGRHAVFDRSAEGHWTAGDPPAAIAPELAKQVEQAVDLLRLVKPERQFTAEEIARMPRATLGLEPPAIRLSVVVAMASTPVTIDFGGENPLGHARYALVGDALWLVPRHLADAWDDVVKHP